MPLYYFVLKAGQDRFPDPEGEELADEQAARAHAIEVARELMRNREGLGCWRLEVCDDYLNPCFEILFAEIDATIEHLLPPYRNTVEQAARSLALLHDAILQVRATMADVKQTLTRTDAIIAAASPL
jgi:hypothetical protein